MVTKVLRANALVLSYEALNSEGKISKKSQSLKFINETCTDDDIFEIGTTIGNILAYAPKELRHDQSHILMEV